MDSVFFITYTYIIYHDHETVLTREIEIVKENNLWNNSVFYLFHVYSKFNDILIQK